MTGEVTEDVVIQKLVKNLSEFLANSPYEPLFAFYKGVHEGGVLRLARDLAETVLEQSGSVLKEYYLNGVKQKDLPALDDQLTTLQAEG